MVPKEPPHSSLLFWSHLCWSTEHTDSIQKCGVKPQQMCDCYIRETRVVPFSDVNFFLLAFQQSLVWFPAAFFSKRHCHVVVINGHILRRTMKCMCCSLFVNCWKNLSNSPAYIGVLWIHKAHLGFRHTDQGLCRCRTKGTVLKVLIDGSLGILGLPPSNTQVINQNVFVTV